MITTPTAARVSATDLTALQARVTELEGVLSDMTESHDAALNHAASNEERAEKAEAELDAWKATAEKLALAGELLSDMIDVNLNGLPKSQDVWNKALAAYAKLKGEV